MNKQITSIESLKEQIAPVISRHIPEEYISRIGLYRDAPKVIRDPLFGFVRIRPYEAIIIDTPLFQRLRNIFQTAFAYVSYPSAVHSRFEHSLNCMNLADRVLTQLNQGGRRIDGTDWAQVRLAALLHDIGHCLFSHASETYYKDTPGLRELKGCPEFQFSNAAPGEIINYCIVTSKPFIALWEAIKRHFNSQYPFLNHVDPTQVGDMIVGRPPKGDESRRYLADIINGPTDVDKLDYISRDAYFTGVTMSIDIERFIQSLCVAPVDHQYNGENRSEKSLVVDYKGLAVLEQMLFSRMVLYDSVYHHHKVRVATQHFLNILKEHGSKSGWPTPSGLLTSVPDLLAIDEYDFYGSQHADPIVASDIRKLRNRSFYKRALILTARACVDQVSGEYLNGINDAIYSETDIEAANRWIDGVRTRAVELARKLIEVHKDIDPDERTKKIGVLDDLGKAAIIIDFPRPPQYTSIGRLSTILLGGKDAASLVVALEELFPFQKVTTNYSQQYKYRAYIFAHERVVNELTYGAFIALGESNVRLNDLALLMAHQDGEGKTGLGYLIQSKADVPNWRHQSAVPKGS